MKQEVCINSLKELENFAAGLFKEITPPAIFLLSGPLGAGKTAFVRAACKALNTPDLVNSPTFNLLHEYDGFYRNKPVLIYHLDYYRLATEEDAEDLDFIDSATGRPFFAFLEWAERRDFDWSLLEIPVYRMSIVLKMDTSNENAPRIYKFERIT